MLRLCSLYFLHQDQNTTKWGAFSICFKHENQRFKKKKYERKKKYEKKKTQAKVGMHAWNAIDLYSRMGFFVFSTTVVVGARLHLDQKRKLQYIAGHITLYTLYTTLGDNIISQARLSQSPRCSRHRKFASLDWSRRDTSVIG